MNVYLELFYGLSITLMLVVGSYILGNVIRILITSKPKGYKLKKARERSLDKYVNRKIKRCIKYIKVIYKNGYDVFEMDYIRYPYDNYVLDGICKWLDDVGIEYRKFNNDLCTRIYFDK